MNSLPFSDIKQLCAYLDGELTESKRMRLEKRIGSEPALAAALDELCETCKLLKTVPQKRAPRNFTLTPRMAGIRPPVPRLVPAFSWASAVAMLLFILTLGSRLVGQLSIGGTAPMLAAAPSGLGGGPPAAATQAPAMAAPATAAPALPGTTDQIPQETPTAEIFALSVPEATPPPAAKEAQPQAPLRTREKTLNPWLVIWPGLGVLLGILALLVWWLDQQAFRRKNRRK
jgi:hypothetical protein